MYCTVLETFTNLCNYQSICVCSFSDALHKSL